MVGHNTSLSPAVIHLYYILLSKCRFFSHRLSSPFLLIPCIYCIRFSTISQEGLLKKSQTFSSDDLSIINSDDSVAFLSNLHIMRYDDDCLSKLIDLSHKFYNHTTIA